MSLSFSEYTKIDVGWGFVPDPTVRAYSAPPDLLAGFKGPLRGRKGMEERGGLGEGRKWEGMGKGECGREGKGGKLQWGIAPWLLGR